MKRIGKIPVEASRGNHCRKTIPLLGSTIKPA